MAAEPAPPGDLTRFRPGLLALAALVLLPMAIRHDLGGWVVGLLAAGVVGGLAAHLLQRTGRLHLLQRSAGATLFPIIGVAGFVVVAFGLWAAGGADLGLDLLLLLVALGAAVGVTPDRRIAVILQTAVLALLMALVTAAGLGPIGVTVVVVQVAALLVLIDVFARRLAASRRVERAARRAAERRAELLATVRELPGSDPDEAAQAVVDRLGGLGFDLAAVVVREGDHLIERAVYGTELFGSPVPRGVSPSWQAIDEDRTVVIGDYQQPPEHAVRARLRAVVATPVRVDGRPVAVVAGARRTPARPSAAETEMVEVMAAHLGRVFAAHQGVERQQQLLERAGDLDRLSQGLLTAVSEEVRDPLTIVRGVVELLRVHADRLDRDQRAQLLERLREESDDLRLVIDTILDFTRFHTRRVDPQPESVPTARLRDLLQGEGFAVTCDRELLDRQVWIDPDLATPALQLLLASGHRHDEHAPVIAFQLTDEGNVQLDLPASAAVVRSQALRSLATQLLLAGGGELGTDGSEILSVRFATSGRSAPVGA